MPDRSYYHPQRGEGRIKFLLTMLVIVVIIYIAMQFIPVYWRSIQMQDETQKIVSQAALRSLGDSDVRAQLEAKANELNLPDNKRFQLSRNGKKVMVRVTYIQTIPLPFYTFKWSFDFHKEDTGF